MSGRDDSHALILAASFAYAVSWAGYMCLGMGAAFVVVWFARPDTREDEDWRHNPWFARDWAKALAVFAPAGCVLVLLGWLLR